MSNKTKDKKPMEKQAVVKAGVTPTLKDVNVELEKNATVEDLDNDFSKNVSDKVFKKAVERAKEVVTNKPRLKRYW